MNAILKRRSIRKYKDKKISDDIVEELLRAGMAAPSAVNEQPWQFIVLRDKETMKKITKVHEYSKMLLEADFAIVVCGDKSKELVDDFWVQDCSAATENILIEAQDKGLGAVWLGVYPIKERVDGIKEILNLPEGITPLSVVPIGYPAENKEPVDRFSKERVHYDRW
ncbi:nitroreductase family protein [Clostridium botulinum]|uniref:nitroreductase family protein n=1 Tax=Clostridium botulinum TaxID=1491 RepID=UPI000A16F32B|nr:nitroreductase family protein [Clostridium botulinum]AUN17993.1 nitroreductase family protein [Clostridium botulinum]OSA87645.1 nitroreductase family protein [Clostridium botulinum]